MEINLIFHPSNSILAEKDSFCLKRRCFPTAVASQTYCDLNFFLIDKGFIKWWSQYFLIFL